MGDLRNWKLSIWIVWGTIDKPQLIELKSNTTKTVDKIYVRTHATILNIQLCKVCDSYPRSIISRLGIVLNVTNLTKGQFTDRFFKNYEGSLLDLAFQNDIDC